MIFANADVAYVQEAMDRKKDAPVEPEPPNPAASAEHPETPNDGNFFALMQADAHDFSHPNTFAQLASDDRGDLQEETEDLVAALQQLTPHVSKGKTSQKQARAQRKGPPPLTRAQIQRIAETIEKGELKLPDLDLPSDADYAAVWALVDSGSSVHVVDAAESLSGRSG